MKVKKESEKAGLKLSIQKMKIMTPSPITSWQINGQTMESVTDFIFLGSIITADDDCSRRIQRHLLLERQAMTNVSSAIQSCLTLGELIDCSTPGFPFLTFTISQFAQTHVHWVSDGIQPSHPLLSPSPPAFILPQDQGLFQWVLRIRWPKYWSFSFSISPANEYSGLISFRTDCFDFLAVQATLKSLLQYHSSKASILQCSAFFIVQLSHA